MPRTRIIVDCSTGQARTVSLTAEEETARVAEEQAARLEGERQERIRLASERDLSEYRTLIRKLRPSSTDNLTLAEIKLVGRLIGWLWLREEMDG